MTLPDRRRAEEVLRQSNAERVRVEEALRESESRLRIANERLEAVV